MWMLNFQSVTLITLIAAFIAGCKSDYSHLDAIGASCPLKDQCANYKNNLTYMDRSCECDRNCAMYKDCCIDALPNRRTQSSRQPAQADVECLHYGAMLYTGVYVISKCSSNWNGPSEVSEKCLGGTDFTDPLSAAPTTDVSQRKTYRNLACAECNNANLASLRTFQLKLSCRGLEQIPEDQIMADLRYNEELRLWGMDRLNRFGNGTEFVGCDIIFDVPGSLNNSVRFCRSNIISKCASNWTRPVVAKLCAQYMAVVYSSKHAYRNPDCAICNHISLTDVMCERTIFGTRGHMTFAALVDIYRDDGVEHVGKKQMSTPACPSNQIYDPFLKTCKQLACALPGYRLVRGKCSKG